MRRRGLLLALALVAAAHPALAGETVDIAKARERGWFREDHYAIVCDDVQVGWMRRSLALVPAPVETPEGADPASKPGDQVVREVEIRIDVAGDGNEIVTVSRSAFASAGEQLLLSASTERRDGARRVARTITRNGQRFDVVTERGADRVEGAVAAFPLSLADELAFERVAQLEIGGSVTASGIDLGTLAETTRTLTVAPRAPEAAAGAIDVRVRTAAGGETIRIAPGTGAALEGGLGPRFRYRLETAERAKDPAFRTSLEKLSRVPLLDAEGNPAKLGDTGSIRRIVVSWAGPRGRAFVASGRQTLARGDGGAVTVTVDRSADGAPVTDAARDEALRDDEGMALRDPIVGRAAAALLAGTADHASQLAKFLEFTSGTMRKTIVLGTPSAAEILADPAGDCSEHARALVALCRVVGIPARVVDGLAWTGDESGSFGWHSWVEVAIAGRWLPVDPTTGASPAPATHLAVDAAPEARTLLWRTQLRLVSVEREPPADAPK